jgi:membrane protein
VRLLRERFYSFALILGVGFLLLVSLVLSASLAAMGKFFGAVLPTSEGVLQALTSLVSFVVITAMFGAIYKLMPDVRLEWGDVIVGASVTALFFTIGKYLIGLYLGKTTFGSTYGAAGSLVVVLVWVYYSSQLFFLGAEFTKVYTKQFGSHFTATLELNTPNPDAVILRPSATGRTTENL